MDYDIPVESWFANVYKSPRLISLIEVLQFVILVVIVYYFNPFGISTKYAGWTQFFMFTAAFLFVTMYFFLKQKINLDPSGYDGLPNKMGPTEYDLLRQMISTVVFLVAAVIIVKYALLWITSSTLKRIIQMSLTILFLLGAMALVYIFFAPIIKKIQANAKAGDVSYVTFLFNVIMFLPCLLLQLLETIKKEFNITSPMVWTLLAFEAVIVGLYFVLPVVAEKIVSVQGIQLLKGPVYLSQEHNLGDFQTLYVKSREKLLRDQNLGLLQTDNGMMEDLQQRHYYYAISAWFYINPQPPSTNAAHSRFTRILDYASKPVIEYNGATNELRIQTETTSDQKAGTKTMATLVTVNDIPLQKWNNIVVNYDHGTMDVFVNGKLVSSKPGVAPYMEYETMVAGFTSGITGGLCNVMFYPEPVTQSFVQTLYKTLRVKEFPVF